MLNYGYIQGYVASQPTLDYTIKTGTPVAKFRLGCERDVRPNGKVYYDFMTFVATGKKAELVMQTLQKDQTVFIEYALANEKYVRPDGKTASRMMPRVVKIRFDRLRDPYNANISQRDKDFSPESSEYEGFDEEGFYARTPIDPDPEQE